MQIESVEIFDHAIQVFTTGASFHLTETGIEVGARIPRESSVGVIKTSSIAPWVLHHWDQDELSASSGSLHVSLSSDGFLRLSSASQIHVHFTPGFAFDRKFHNKLASQWRCAEFGCGTYRLPGTPFNKATGEHKVVRSSPFFFHVFPPRPADPAAFAARISHEGRPQKGREYPSDEIIREAAKHTRVLALHAYFWHEEDKALRPKFSRYRFRKCPWRSAHHIPIDEVELTRVMKTARAEGMKFVPYVSPRYSSARDVLGELDRLMQLYDFDGFYLDGLRGNFVDQRHFVRALRKNLGSQKIIYLNGSNQPFNSARITAPFIDSHCDYVLRGDSGRGGLQRDDFLRLCVSGKGAGNQVGVWCHYGSSGLPFPFDRAPSPADQQAAQSQHVQLWRRSFWK